MAWIWVRGEDEPERSLVDVLGLSGGDGQEVVDDCAGGRLVAAGPENLCPQAQECDAVLEGGNLRLEPRSSAAAVPKSPWR